MGQEEQVVSQMSQLVAAGINLNLKLIDIPLALLKEDNSVLKDWVDKGGEILYINIEPEYAAEFMAKASRQGLATERKIMDKDGQIIGLNGEEILVETFGVRSCDFDRALHLRDTIERQHNSSMVLSGKEASEMFKNVETNTFENLTKREAEILQKEFTENGVHSAMAYDKDTGTYALEIADFDMIHQFPGEMTRVEVSLVDALIKTSYPEMARYMNIDEERKRSINRAIAEEVVNNPQGYYEQRTIFDSANPNNRINLNEGKAVYDHNGVVKGFDLSVEKDVSELKEAIRYMTAPDMKPTVEYIDLKAKNPDVLGAVWQEQGKMALLEDTLNHAAEQIRQQGLMQVDLELKKNYSGEIENIQKEIRIGDSDKIKDIIVKSVTTDEIAEKLQMPKERYEQLAIEEMKKQMDQTLNHMGIDKTGVHQDFSYIVRQEDLDFAKSTQDIVQEGVNLETLDGTEVNDPEFFVSGVELDEGEVVAVNKTHKHEENEYEVPDEEYTVDDGNTSEEVIDWDAEGKVNSIDFDPLKEDGGPELVPLDEPEDWENSEMDMFPDR